MTPRDPHMHVSKPYLPNISRYTAYVEQIFASSSLTNGGPLVTQLEKDLAAFLGVEHLLLVTNGTTALQVAYKVLGLSGEVITTPFSFVATISAMLWQNIQPVFADINAQTLNIDPDNIEEQITPRTTGMVPVHTFGMPCDVDRIDHIARKHGLKVVYDAAHAFGVQHGGKSILSHGDISIVSFHATKIFHTVEGGALIFKNKGQLELARSMIDFGFDASKRAHTLGINAKMSEFHAAMGLCLLEDIGVVTAARHDVAQYYLDALRHCGGVYCPCVRDDAPKALAYFPVLFKNENITLHILGELNRLNIWPRRYFYPALNRLPYLDTQQEQPIAEDCAKRILCLPLHHDVDRATQDKIIDTIKKLTCE
jgi:dTDP-4-amino-4,6-dideoxygalactose transaminase